MRFIGPQATQVLQHPGAFALRTLKSFKANQGLLLAGGGQPGPPQGPGPLEERLVAPPAVPSRAACHAARDGRPPFMPAGARLAPPADARYHSAATTSELAMLGRRTALDPIPDRGPSAIDFVARAIAVQAHVISSARAR